MTDKLKPCPFCGGKHTQIRGSLRPEQKNNWVKCLTCGAEQDCSVEKEEAIKAWNTRADEAENKRLREALEKMHPILRTLATWGSKGKDALDILKQALKGE